MCEEVAILSAAKAQQDAIDAAERGDLDGAKGMLRAAAARLREVGGDSAHAEGILSRADAIEQITDRDAWRAIERKALRFQAHRAGRGRDRK